MIRLYVICHTLQYGVRNIITTLSVIYGLRKVNVMLSVIRELRKFNVIIISRIRGVGNQHYVICHAREYMVWKINAMLSVLHGNTGCGKSTWGVVCHIRPSHGPSFAAGASFALRKSLELAAKYVTVLYRMHSSQSVQRMHHLQGHWF